MRNPALHPLRCCLLAAAIAPAALCGLPALAAAGTAAAERNVYAAGGQVRPSAPVQGDFTAAGAKVAVDQPVAGDATVAGGAVEVRAPVGDDLRAVGGDVSVESTVGGELFATGGNITLTPASAVARGATLYGSSVAVDGRIDGDLQVTAGKVSIDGEVRGDVRLVADEIVLGPKARIGGTLRYASPSALQQAEGATIAGAVTRDAGQPPRGPHAGAWRWERSFQGPYWAGGVMSFLALLAAAALFLLLLPRFGALASQRIQSSPWLVLGVGFGTVVAMPVLAVLLFITLLGIPLGIAVLALYPVLLLAGFLVGVLFIGRKLAVALRQQEPRGFGSGMGYAAAGLLLTLLVGGVPVIGGVLVGLLSLAGVGACVLELHGRRQGPAAGSPAAPPVLAASAA